MAEDLESACYDVYNLCTADCEKYSTDEYDIWNRWTPESNIPRVKREKCKARCLSSQNSCIRRKRALEQEQRNTEELGNQPVDAPPMRYGNLPPMRYGNLEEEQEELESQVQETQEGTAKEETQTINDESNRKPENTDSSYSLGEPKGEIAASRSNILQGLRMNLAKYLPSSIAGFPTLLIITAIAGIIIGLRIVTTGRKR